MLILNLRTKPKIITPYRSEANFNAAIYQKSAHTGFIDQFHSFIPDCHKEGFTYSRLFQYFNICSSYFICHFELQKRKKMFIKKE